MSEGYWTSWRTLGKAGPSRWSVNHCTLDGKTMLCGKEMPPDGRLFDKGTVGNHDCPKCSRELAKRRAK